MDMEQETTLWTATQTNNFVFKQLKACLMPHEFIVCPTIPHSLDIRPPRRRRLIRVHDHHVQMVCQDILRGESWRLILLVSPAWSYRTDYGFDGDVILKGRNGNSFRKLAIRKEPDMKAYYQPEEVMETWDKITMPSLQEEVIDYFNHLDFANYASLCENYRDNTLRYSYSLGNEVLRYLAIAYNCLWEENYEKGKDILERTIVDAPNVNDCDYKMDLHMGEEILEILRKKEDGWEKKIQEKLCCLEKDALEKAWGIAVDDNGKTVKKRK